MSTPEPGPGAKVKRDLQIMGGLIIVIMLLVMLAAVVIAVMRPRDARAFVTCPNCGAQLELVPVEEKKK